MKYSDLKKEIIEENKCIRCGGCEATCPVNAIEIKDTPELIDECIECGNCYNICPRTEKETNIESKEIKEYFAAKTLNEEIKNNAQDGGAVSTVIKNLLKKEEIDGAILTDNKKWKPVPKVITDQKEVPETAGTKYGLVPLLKEIKKTSDLKNIAIVGTPCHIEAARYLEKNNVNNISYLISVFCMENFDYDCLIHDKLKEKGIYEEEIQKMDIGAGKLKVITDRKTQKIDLKEIKPCAIKGCGYCSDFHGNYSDISIGSVDSPNEYSTVLIKTKKGKKSIKLASKELKTKEIKKIDTVKKLTKIKQK